MAADGNTAPITANAPSETSVSGDQPAIMPVIVQDTTGAITRDSISTISKPDTGTIRVIDTGNLPEINFSFAAKDVKLSALDVDLVMIFNDNSKIILPNLAMDLVGANPPRLTFKGSVASPQAVVAQIGQTSLVEITPSVQLSSPDFLPRKKGGNTNNSDQNTTGQNGIGGGEPPVPPQPVVSGAKSGKTGENDGAKTADFSAPPLEKVQASNIANGTTPNAFSSASVIPTAMKADPLASATAYSFSQVPVIAKMYQIVEAHPQQSGTNIIYGGSGASPADTDYRFAEQIKAETLTGTDASDNIYADNPAFSAGGMAGRVISITPSLATGFTMDTLVISGVPSLYKVLNGTALGGDETHGYSYKINAYSNGSSEFRLQLAYQVPDNVTSQNSMDAKAVLSLTFTGVKTGTAQSVTASGSIYFNVSDVANDAEQITTNYTDGITVVNLSFHPAGNSIAGGAGDDTIHAAAGADTIDGGTGNDWVYYDMSRLGVSVDLKAGKGYSGFATGDTYTNIHNIMGSTAADTLYGDDFGDSIYGNGGHDCIFGGKGNDYFKVDSPGSTFDGGDGFDKLDFSGSTEAITVDINSGTAAPANNVGYDVIRNIEAIVGTSRSDDMLISGTAGSWLDAGDGNDTLVSGAGADTLYAGAGIDTLSYINSTAGVTVNLAATANSMTATGGYATGDVIEGFENVIGSNQDDVLIGSPGANVLDGRDGNDSLNGGGGNDTLMGGYGNDSLDGNGTSVDPYAVDVVDYTYATAGVTLSVGSINSSTAYTFSVGGSATDVDTLKNFEGIIGGSGNDSLTGDSNANYLSGGSGGADTLSGGGGNDILKLDWSSLNLSNLDGGAGNDTVVLTGTGSVSLNFTQASFTGVLTNAEYLDFSAATSANKVSLNIDGAGIQKILTGATSNTNAGTLDLKLDTGHYDTLTLATNASYTYSNTSSAADASRLSGAVNVSTLNAAGSDIYVFDSTHTTLLAQLHYHT